MIEKIREIQGHQSNIVKLLTRYQNEFYKCKDLRDLEFNFINIKIAKKIVHEHLSTKDDKKIIDQLLKDIKG